MVSHYDYKLRKRIKPIVLETIDRENHKEEIQATYLRWTDQGRECESLKQGCSFCSMAQYGFSRHEVGVKKCWQPEANEQLLEKAKKLAEGKPVKLVRKHEKKWS